MKTNWMNLGVFPGLYLAVLAEPSARITNKQFVVTIPALMGGIVEKAITPDKPVEDPLGKAKLPIDKEVVLNKDFTARDKDKLKDYNVATTIVGENLTWHAHRIDGFVKHGTIKKLTAETGAIESDTGKYSGPTTPAGCGAHTHETTGTHKRTGIKQKKLTWTGLNFYMMEQVDLENINNKVLKKGDILYGTFIIGAPNKFVITCIPDVTPRTEHEIQNGQNVEIKDTSKDGDKNPAEKEA